MIKTQLVVIGGGPGGYPAAFRAADMGLDVTMIDMESRPGGVCLHRGCIPSKALLHAAALLRETEEAGEIGLHFERPIIDLDKLRAWKDSIIDRLSGGLHILRNKRKIQFIQGRAAFRDKTELVVQQADGTEETMAFEHAIIATGSRPVMPAIFDVESCRLMSSTNALALRDIPEELLVVGGGYIGLELGSVYAALGSRVSVVEMLPSLLSGADPDLVKPLAKRLKKQFKQIMLETKVTGIALDGVKLKVSLQDKQGAPRQQAYDRVLVSIGRRPNSEELGLENTSVRVEHGFIETDNQCRTAEPAIFAIGDVAGQPMLAHKATHEGLVASQVIAGGKQAFEPRCIPAVVFTDPEIAWCGLTETEAKEQMIEVKTAVFPWAASGRAMTLERSEGLTKLIVDPQTERILGAGIVGPNAGDMIAECAHAMEMGALASDLALTIHPHPTLSETIMEAAEVFYGHCVHKG